MNYYTLEICGLRRKLPLIHISRKTRFASFSILGDTELVGCVAKKILEKIKKQEFDYLVGPEVKVVPLIHELARQLKHKRYVICRKSVKPNMISPVILEPLAHFPKHVRRLVLDGQDAELLRGKKVVIVDDVVSTGVTIRMMKHMMKKVGAEVVMVVAIFKQGEQFDEIENIFTLGELPVFKEKKNF